MRYSFDDANARTKKQTQYYEMIGTRGIWHDGWKAVTNHGPLPSNLGHAIGVEFLKEKTGATNEALGTMRLSVDGKVVAEGPFRTQSGHYALAGEGLCIGYDSADPVSRDYEYLFPLKRGQITSVVFEAGAGAHSTPRPSRLRD